MAKERNWGVDMLRIMSMLMVCVLHVLCNGGVLDAPAKLSGVYNSVWLLEISC